MDPVLPARLAAGPVPPAQQHHVQVEHRRGQREEVERRPTAGSPRAEVVELRGDRQVLELAVQAAPERRADQPEEDRDRAEQAPRMNATVTFEDRSDATIPTAISIAPISQ